MITDLSQKNMSFQTLLRRFRYTSRVQFFSTKPDFTSDRYKVERGPYANICNDHVTFFNNLLGQNRVITDAEECEGYNIDYSKIVRGKWKCVRILFSWSFEFSCGNCLKSNLLFTIYICNNTYQYNINNFDIIVAYNYFMIKINELLNVMNCILYNKYYESRKKWVIMNK